MSLLSLPNELLICIAQHVEGFFDLNAFTRTNHRLHNLLIPILYRYIVKDSGNEALRWASLHGEKKRVERLFEAGVTFENIINGRHPETGKMWWTPLSLAVENGHLEIVELLLDKGADANAESRGLKKKCCETPLYRAAESGNIDMVKVLLKKGASCDQAYGCYGTALMVASYAGHEQIVRLLLETGAGFAEYYSPYSSPLIYASKGGFEHIVRLLLDHGDRCRITLALVWAVHHGHDRIVAMLLDHGADCDGHLENSVPPLRWYDPPLQSASARGHAQIVKLLIAAGADVNIHGGDYGNPLQAASFHGRREVVEILLDAGANIHARVESYSYEVTSRHDPEATAALGSPLNAALAMGENEVAELLRARGAVVVGEEDGNHDGAH